MRTLLLAGVVFAIMCSSCSVHYLVGDTASDKVIEYANDYYVGYSQDSVLEFHYDLWSENGEMWLTVLNRSDSMAFLRPDSCWLTFNGVRLFFDQFADWEEYIAPIENDSVINLVDPERYLPLQPGQWKGLLGPYLDINIPQWKSYAEGEEFERERSPVTFKVHLCYISAAKPGVTQKEEHAFWVEYLRFYKGSEFHKIARTEEFESADKFYLFNISGAGTATLLGAILPVLLLL